jgi:cardiolipin synthase
MFKAIEDARKTIDMETFIFEDDDVGRRLADLFIKKQRAGVQVNLLYDSAGSLGTPDSFFEGLRDSGVNVVEFNPVNPLKAGERWDPTLRDHRKILIVDGKTAITGGVNISRVYSSKISGAVRKKEEGLPWRDTDIVVEGPAAAEFQNAFIDLWVKQGGPFLDGRGYFSPVGEKGKDLVQVVASNPGKKNRTTFIMYVTAVSFAEKSIHMSAAYFVPDRQMIDALKQAAARGVDVKIIVPQTSDSSLALYAGRYYYTDLLAAGIQLYERRERMLHSKTAVIDGVWSTVGSTNLDFWSFANNYEINAVVLGRDFAGEMEKAFEVDLRRSDRIREEEWRRRPFRQKVREYIAHLFERIL